MKKLLVAIAIAGMCAVGIAHAEGKPSKFMVCAGCHTATGKGIMSNYPNIGGQRVEYFTLAVNAYKNGERTGSNANLMKPFANMLSDDDIKELAEYFARQDNQ